MSEPRTPHGQHLHRFLCKFEEPHGCHTKETIAAVEAEAAAQEWERLRTELEPAFDALGGMWSWNDAYLDDPANAHLWTVRAGRILRDIVGRPARDPDA